MTLPAGLLDQSAIAKLLASMTGGANLPTPQGINPQAPPPPQMQQAFSQGLAQNPVMGDGPGLLGRQTSPGDDPTHSHRKGIRGSLLHAVGADRVAPEVAALLSPDQTERVKPGLLSTVYNAVVQGKGPGAVMQERATQMLGRQDEKKARDRMAQDEVTRRRIETVAASMPPQEGAEYAARMFGIYGLAQAPQVTQAAVGLKERQFAPQAPRAPITKNTEDGIMQYNLETNQWEPMRDSEGRPMMAPPPQAPPNQYLPTVTPEGTPTYTAVPGRGTGAPVETGLVRAVPGGQSPQEIKVINNERTLAYDDAQLSIAGLMGADGKMKPPPSSWDRVVTRSDWTNFLASDEGQNYMGNTRKLIRSWVVLIEGKRMSDADARVNEMMRSFRPGDKSLTVDGKMRTLESMAKSISDLGRSGVALPMPGSPATPAAPTGRTVTVNGKTFVLPE